VAGDLERPNLPQLGWDRDSRAASLTTVFEHAVGLSVKAEEWYAVKRPAKRAAGRMLRVATVILGAIAAVIPILSEITTTNGKPAVAPGWAAVSLAVAAALITLDRFFGFSSGWMRFMQAEMQLTRIRHTFEYVWNSLRSSSQDPPDDAQLKAYLKLAEDFVIAVDRIVAAETTAWIKEFRGGLERTEHGLRDSRP
jgi:hypothetical protein